MARIGWTALIVAVAGLAFAAGASAVSPDVQAMNLQAADVPGAKVVNEHAATLKGYTAAHVRSFEFSAPNGGSRLVSIDSEVALASSPSTATADVAAAERGFRSTAGRKVFIAATAKVLKVKAKAVALGRPHKVAGYDQGIEVAASVKLQGIRVYVNLIYVRLDRVFLQMVESGTRPIGAGVTGKYAGAIASHIATELSPIGISAPTVTGTAQQGQTLTATPGTWTATDATFAYQWQHCDAAGANCTDIAGATAQTYAVNPADVGTTLHVVVKAANRFGSGTAASTSTAVVT